MEGATDRRWTLVAVCVTTFMLLLDITIVIVALPSIQRQLHAGLTGLQWVVDAYALTLAALILTAGALADRYGRRLVFVVGVAVFSTASLVCGLAWTIAALDIARAVQGVGGAALFATALALIGHEYEGRERVGAIAIWGATIGAAVASGPLVGGILTDAFGWRWVFFVNVPVGAFALFVALTRMGESRDVSAVRTDVAGLLTFSGALFLIVFGLLRGNDSGWSSALIVGCLAGGAALLALLRFLPLTVFVFAVPLLTPNLVQRVQPRVILGVGLALVALALLLMHGLTASSTWTALLAGLIVGGIGIGLSNPTIAGTALRVVDPKRTGMASGINNAFRLAGVAVGVAALGAVLEDKASSSLAASLGPHGRGLASAVSSTGARVGAGRPHLAHAATTAFVSGLDATLLVACAVVAVGALAAAALIQIRLAPQPAQEPAAAPGDRVAPETEGLTRRAS